MIGDSGLSVQVLFVAKQVAEGVEALGLSYHVGGSFASSTHGIGRQTRDVDLVVDLEAEHVSKLVAQFSNTFYVSEESVRRAVRDRSSFNMIHLESGLKIDIFAKGTGAFDLSEFVRHQPVEVQPGLHLMVKSAEDTLLRKLLWFRLGGESSENQWGDIQGILRVQGEQLDRPYVERWADELEVADLLARATASL